MPPARRPTHPQAPAPTQAPTQSQWQAQSHSQQQQPTRARARPPSRPASRNESTAQASGPSSTANTQQAGAAPVRRNLFSSTLSRRPQATSSEPTAASGAAAGSRAASMPSGAGSSAVASGSGFTPVASSGFGGGNPAATQTGSPGPIFRGTSHGGAEGHAFARGTARKDEILDEDDDILVPEPADAKGKKAALEKELLIRNLEEANLAAASTAACANAGDGVVVLDDAPEMDEKERSARLIELYRSHARQQIDPNELKAAVQESLRKKISSLDEDKWMYEAESDSEES